ncbi:hypothetical protein Tco_0995533 [Tanacetum coccineum]
MGDRPVQSRFERLSKQSNEPTLSRVNTLGSGDDSMKLQELMDLCTKLSDKVLDLENVKNAQALEIQKLKKRVKKLKKKSLDDPEDASKQGRNEIDQDEGISWFLEGSETQGRHGHDSGVNTASTSITTASINITTIEPVTTANAPVTTAGVSVSTAEPSTPPPPPTTTTTTPIKDEDLTIAQTLMKMKSEKSKAKGVTMQEPSESRTRVKVPPLQIDPKDKGKAKMVEPEKPKKKKDQIEEEAANIVEWDDVQAMMDADYELCYDGCRLWHLCKTTSMKNREDVDKLMKRSITIFWKEGKETLKAVGKEAVSKKRTGEKLDEESVKRQKVEEDAEKAELKTCLEIVPKDDEAVNVESLATKYPIVDWKTHILAKDKMYYEIIRADGSTKNYKIFSAMLDDFDRQDVLDLYRLVKERFETTSPEGYDRLLLRDLITLFELSGRKDANLERSTGLHIDKLEVM